MRRLILLDTLGVLVGAVLLLLIAGRFVDLRQLHVGAWNDQVGYVSVARNLVEQGEMSSNVVYTSTLKQKATRNYLYMPGHYLVLALSFVLAGFGPIQAVMPSMICYCIATVCVFLTCRKLYGRRSAFIAAAVFALFPSTLSFSFTAMAELTLMAAISLAFCILVHLPPLYRPYCGAFLLLIPFMFRETAALFVIPMAAIILGGIPLLGRIERGRWTSTAIFCLLAVGLCVYLYKSPAASGRPSLLKANVFDTGEKGIYLDATAEERLPTSASAWLKAIRSNVVKNTHRLAEIRHSLPTWHEPVGLGALFFAVGLSLVVGLHRRDAMIFACGVLGLCLMAFLFGLYHVRDYRGLRTLLFGWPLWSIVIGTWLAGLSATPILGRTRPWMWGTAALVVSAASLALACRATRFIAFYDEFDKEMIALVESVGHDRERMFATPYWMGLQYTAAHYPVKWAFLPENAQTLALLMRRYDVGTLLVTRGSTSLRAAQIAKLGFVLEQQVEWRKHKILVYKRVDRPPMLRPLPPTDADMNPYWRLAPCTQPCCDREDDADDWDWDDEELMLRPQVEWVPWTEEDEDEEENQAEDGE